MRSQLARSLGTAPYPTPISNNEGQKEAKEAEETLDESGLLLDHSSTTTRSEYI
jgi:hypothetical protein